MPSSAASSEDKIVILDFGSQYTQVIARRVRDGNDLLHDGRPAPDS